MRKGEIACTSNFSFSHCILKRFVFPGASEGVIVWEWVNTSLNIRRVRYIPFDETDLVNDAGDRIDVVETFDSLLYPAI